ncbi:hypothetical protein TB1_030524 [Malus domestica]
MDLNLGLNIIALPMVPLILTSTGFDSLCWFLSDSVVALLYLPSSDPLGSGNRMNKSSKLGGETYTKRGNICSMMLLIRGDTTHYDAVANPAASGVLSTGLKLARCETMPWKDSEGRAEWNEGPCKVIF